jgi:hypothetical protein
VAVATKDAGFAIKHVHLTINNRDWTRNSSEARAGAMIGMILGRVDQHHSTTNPHPRCLNLQEPPPNMLISHDVSIFLGWNILNLGIQISTLNYVISCPTHNVFRVNLPNPSCFISSSSQPCWVHTLRESNSLLLKLPIDTWFTYYLT